MIFVENAGPDELIIDTNSKWSENGMKTLEISIQPLTPILTGGADRTTDRLHETGIIGSLRWWYEAIVRGLGGSACDPTKRDPAKPNYILTVWGVGYKFNDSLAG